MISSLKKDIERGLNDTIFALKPLRFYYDDKQFSNISIIKSKTSHKEELSFNLSSIPRYHSYFLIDGTDTILLSTHPMSILYDSNDKLELNIRGYIHEPNVPEIIIENKEENLNYVIPVIFYKKISIIGWFFIGLTITIFAFFIIIELYVLIVWLFVNKNKFDKMLIVEKVKHRSKRKRKKRSSKSTAFFLDTSNQKNNVSRNHHQKESSNATE